MIDRFGFDGPAEVVAHRGYSARAPENTVAAMESAIEAGGNALEFDLHVASDGTPHLFHDATLGRTTNGTGEFSDCTSEELAELDAGSWFGPDFAGEPVPTLRHTLERVRGRVGRVYAEIKGYREPSDVDLIVDVVSNVGMLDTTVFISMDWDALARIRAASAETGIGYIVELGTRIDEGLSRAGGDPNAMLDFDARLLLADPTLADRALAASIELATWTVNRVDDADRLLEMGVPRITTNEVEALLAWKAEL